MSLNNIPWGNLRFLGERQEEIMHEDEHGTKYGSGKYGPLLYDLLCDCGYDFSIPKNSFPGKRKMRTCGRPECEYEQYRLATRSTPSLLVGERPDPADDPRVKALGDAEAKRLGRALAGAASLRERVEMEKAYFARKGKLGRPKLPPEQQSMILPIRIPIHLVESIAELVGDYKISKNAMIVNFVREGVRLLKKDS